MLLGMTPSCRPDSLRKPLRPLALLFIASGLSGCLSPMALDHVAIAYNESAADVISKQLLLNIARARFDQPIYFSGISNIAATLNFQANAGVTPALTGSSGTTLMPILVARHQKIRPSVLFLWKGNNLLSACLPHYPKIN
jgi:hypothetical protein